jgi:hypothetical protein
MTNPGQQAAQQAAASASRAAQQQASMAYQNQVRHASSAAQRQHYRAGGRRRFGLLGRLFAFLFSLVILAVAAGIFLAVLSQAQPQWFHSIMTWLNGLF